MEKVTLVDKEILIATVNRNYCAIGNNDRSADFLEIPIKEKGFVKVIEVYFLVLASRFFYFAFAAEAAIYLVIVPLLANGVSEFFLFCREVT